MVLPTITEVLSLLDSANESIVGGNEIELQKKYGLESLVPLYIEAFYKIKNWPGRMNIAYWIVRYARIYPEIVELGIHGLNDRSSIVRYHCCAILAYAGRDDSIPFLEKLVNHRNVKTREDAKAAIDAIINKNHNLFADREHKGNVFWDVGKIA